MKRDAWYAAIAAAGLSAAAALYGLVAAPELADPEVSLPRQKLTASLPSPPDPVDHGDVLGKALEILKERDPFVKRAEGESATARGLELPKLGPPVRFSEPGENATVTSVAPSPVPEAQPAPAAAQQPEQPAPSRGQLTLRGVFPSPGGGRALVAMPDGSMVSVGVGGNVGGWRVLQVQQGAIRLGRGQRTILLAMPR